MSPVPLILRIMSGDTHGLHVNYISLSCRKITRLEGGRSEMELLRSIEEAAFSILSQLGSPPPRRIQQGSLRSILAQLQSMKTYVDDTVDMRLDFYIEVGQIKFLRFTFIDL